MSRPGSVVLAIAGKEFKESLRNKWLAGASVLFVVLSIAIAGYGTARSGEESLVFALTIASLVSLVIYLVPMMALLLGSAAICGEDEQGSLGLLLSQPITKGQIIFGKFLGLAVSLVIAIISGFGLTGLLLLIRVGAADFGDYLLFTFTTIFLGLSFLSLSLLLSTLVKGKSGAAIGAVVIWFFTVFIFDLILLGVFILAAGKNQNWFSTLLYLNPVDVFRIINISQIEELQASSGLVGLIPANLSNFALASGVLLSWIILPLGITNFLFKKREL